MRDPDDMFHMEPEPDRPPFEDDDSWWQQLDVDAESWELSHSPEQPLSLPSVDNSVDNL